MTPHRKKREWDDQSVKEGKILIKKSDIQYNLPTRMKPEGDLQNDTAKTSLQNDETKKYPEDTRRTKHLHNRNKEQNRILTIPQKRGIFIEEITHQGTSSEYHQKRERSIHIKQRKDSTIYTQAGTGRQHHRNAAEKKYLHKNNGLAEEYLSGNMTEGEGIFIKDSNRKRSLI
ncbi:hypothetical protein C922_05587 [Plasmodium inui San Antonio 1]|uniref:Uncharacterized protein n=1 Tax=Plasmodium inui San Antonio 1 TaxID=1237626 RepID=W7A4M0_9APIC|nr:hypothetical protein C922_05587 [Plasmodium inui San Antonio 1]EUD64034.1 hypothetical protein C922_05587 [Plasmodium inui San Antonio 1]